MREGNRLILTCVIKAGVPKPKVSWYKNEIPLTDKETPNLILEKLAGEDEGQYKCKAQNSGGFSDAIINVIVDGKFREVLAFVCLSKELSQGLCRLKSLASIFQIRRL